MINVWRVKARVESGGHDVPEEKIVARYDKALALVKELIKVCDICHIYDNSASRPFRIFKKRKERIYFDECDDWHYEDVCALTDISSSLSHISCHFFSMSFGEYSLLISLYSFLTPFHRKGRLFFLYFRCDKVNTTDENYYKWTQWIFLQLFKKGLAYKSEMPINFCTPHPRNAQSSFSGKP